MTDSFFNAEFFSNNRKRLRALCDPRMPIVVTANGLLQRGADSTFAFAQDANFWYLTGIDEADAILVIDATEEYIITPQLSDYQVAFDGSSSDQALSIRSGIATVLDNKTGWKRLSERLQQGKQVAGLNAPPEYIDVYGMYTNPARANLIKRLQAQDCELIDISPKLMELRVIKQPVELAAMQEAIGITIAAISDTMREYRAQAFTHEYQLEAEITRGFRTRGATGHAFDPIVASGKRACTLHNIANNGRLHTSDLVVMDVGAEVEQYAADITRTYSLSEPTERQQAVFDAVLDVQSYAMSLLKPGVTLQDYEQKVETYMGGVLQKLGLISETTHENIRHYYPHSTSHFVGLNVHDIGDGRQPLAENMVITVEPGIYIPEEGIGIRIEDDVLITADGIKVLTEKLPRQLQ